jgi:large subunit ribosomal protein L10
MSLAQTKGIFNCILHSKKGIMNKQIQEQKVNEVNELTEQLKDAKSLIVFEYLGLTAKTLTALRRKLHEQNAKMIVYKNNIYTRAIASAGLQGFGEFSGPCAMVVAKGDEIAPFKIIADLIKENKFVVYRDGLLEGSHITSGNLGVISTMPGRNQLYSMFLSCLQGSLRNFLYGLKAVGEKK